MCVFRQHEGRWNYVVKKRGIMKRAHVFGCQAVLVHTWGVKDVHQEAFRRCGRNMHPQHVILRMPFMLLSRFRHQLRSEKVLTWDQNCSKHSIPSPWLCSVTPQEDFKTYNLRDRSHQFLTAIFLSCGSAYKCDTAVFHDMRSRYVTKEQNRHSYTRKRGGGTKDSEK